jgi:hypothetical protein
MELAEESEGAGIRADWATQTVMNAIRASQNISTSAVYAITNILLLSAVAGATWNDYLGNPGGITVPDQAQWEEFRAEGFGEYGRCLDYARSLAKKKPKLKFSFIAYRLRTEWVSATPFLNITANFGLLRGCVSESGFHVGIVYKELVFDNNIWGLTLLDWCLNYLVWKDPVKGVDYNIAEAAMDGFGEIKTFKSIEDLPTHRLDAKWDNGSNVGCF